MHECEDFWISAKSANWVCQTPKEPKELEDFKPILGVDGCLTKWINAKFAPQYPFRNVYDPRKSMHYGLLNRLDRETSGPVIVAKDEKSFWKIKRTRDEHDWHKEYVCLAHGHVPVEQWEDVFDDYMVQT